MRYLNLFLSAGVMAFSTPALAHVYDAPRQDDYCREYTKTVRIGGRTQSAYGKACLQPDGDWKIVSLNGHDDLYDDIRQQVYTNSSHDVYYRPVYTKPFYSRFVFTPQHYHGHKKHHAYYHKRHKKHKYDDRYHKGDHGRGHKKHR